MIKVFVYGTLKKGFYNDYVLGKSEGKFIGEGVTDPCFTLVSLCAYPAVLDKGTTTIKGEVYEVKTLEHLDWLEGYPEFYNRKVITVNVDGIEHLATMYYIEGDIDHQGIVSEGEWNREVQHTFTYGE